jgi:hypothetical protein
MTSSFSGAVRIRGRAERQIWGQGWRLTAAATFMVASLTACDNDGGDEGRATDASDAETRPSPSAETPGATPAPGPRESILIKTRITMFKGRVLAGSLIGDSPFCPGGTVRHERGSPDVGYPAINVFRCTDGQLRIGFGPGPDQLNNTVQTSSWQILDGSGRFAGTSGDGQMKVRWERSGAIKGQETFKGKVVLP